MRDKHNKSQRGAIRLIYIHEYLPRSQALSIISNNALLYLYTVFTVITNFLVSTMPLRSRGTRNSDPNKLGS